MEKNTFPRSGTQDPESPINISEHISESLVTIVGFKLLKFCVSSFVADPGSRIDPESGIDLSVSATLVPDL
jgi:hypothetical protein